jgi:hypothetical protein
MDTSAGSPATSKFDRPVHTWRDIPGWFQWRRHQEEAAAHFPDGSWFVEVGCYLGRSICSLGEVVRSSHAGTRIVGVDTCRGSGPEGRRGTDAHRPAVDHGGGTFAGLLHRNIVDCGLADTIQLVISDSVRAAALFAAARFPGCTSMRGTITPASSPTSPRGRPSSRRAAGCPATTTTPNNGPGWCAPSPTPCPGRGRGGRRSGDGSNPHRAAT